MKHIVKCLYCQSSFDTNIEPFVKVNSTRYAHKICHEKAMAEKSEEEKSKVALEVYIKQLFGYDKLPAKVNKQLKDYTTINKYTYSGILGTLKYFFEIKGNSIEKANGGIGIVPYQYEIARRYYLEIASARDRNQVIIKKQNIEEMPIEQVIITPPKREPMKHTRRLFDFLEQEEENV